MQINFANDLGYGSLKGIIDGHYIHVPSIVRSENTGNAFDPVKSDMASGIIKNYLDYMDVSVNSSSVEDSGRYLVGDRATKIPGKPKSFNIFSNRGKGETDMALIITLSVIASEALQRYYVKNGKLPSRELEADVNMMTALPISEGSHNNARAVYQQRYTACDHEVVIRNFENPVNVKVHFKSVGVILEAQSAQYVIKYAKDGLLKSILSSFSANYPKLYQTMSKVKGIKPADIVHQNHVIGIDLGEGTTDFAVFQNGMLNKYASSSIKNGYGNVLTHAVRYLQSHGFSVNSREQFKNDLHAKGLHAMQVRSDYLDAINRYIAPLRDDIVDEITYDMRHSNNVDVVFVYGGGSKPMEKYLRKPLQEALDGSNDNRKDESQATVPVIFINKKYAQNLNVLGLKMVLDSLNGGAK